jgi:hypothetical protein
VDKQLATLQFAVGLESEQEEQQNILGLENKFQWL